MEATVIDKAWLADHIDDFAGHDERGIATITGSVKALREMVALAIQGLSHDRLIEALEKIAGDEWHSCRLERACRLTSEHDPDCAIGIARAALAAARGEGE